MCEEYINETSVELFLNCSDKKNQIKRNEIILLSFFDPLSLHWWDNCLYGGMSLVLFGTYPMFFQMTTFEKFYKSTLNFYVYIKKSFFY